MVTHNHISKPLQYTFIDEIWDTKLLLKTIYCNLQASVVKILQGTEQCRTARLIGVGIEIMPGGRDKPCGGFGVEAWPPTTTLN